MFQGEAQYLHGHTGTLTIEVEDSINCGVNMVYPCNEIKKVAWDVLRNFDHALVLREDDPLLPAVLEVYDEQGIRKGHRLIKIVHELLKDKLPIVKLTFVSGDNTASECYDPERSIERCPLCGISLDADGKCQKGGWKKK